MGVEKRAATNAEALSLVPDTQDVITCGKCRNLMTKYRISADSRNRIDLCAKCEDVWLDDGEWELIETLVGSHELANITSQPWQHKVTSDTVDKMASERLSKELGDDYQRIFELREWLEEHPSRFEILAYLSHKSR